MICNCGLPWWAWILFGLVFLAVSKTSNNYQALFKLAGIICLAIGVIGIIAAICLRLIFFGRI